MFHYTIAELQKFIGPNETNQSVTKPDPALTVQVGLESIEPVLLALGASKWPIYLGPREVWRRTGDCESGQREVFVQDPDGYLLTVAENIGRRPLLAEIASHSR